MTYIESIILGIVQGLGEFLPISSSGHLVLASEILGIESSEGSLLFNILLHFGTLVAVFIAYWHEILDLIVEAFKWIADGFKIRNNEKRKFIVLIIVSTLPLALVLPIKDSIESLFSSTLAVGIALIYTSLLLFFSDRIIKGYKTANDATYKNALAVGIMQTIAVVPGVSRAGSTITTGLFCGFSREFAVKYSFIMSIPVILGANVFSVVEAITEQTDLGMSIPVCIAGMVAAAVSGILAIALVRYITKNDKFIYFAGYTFVVGLATIIINILG
ncbi:MAG: undecaprenyl-diphosphate phosphatase [Clostridia bacterium]